MSKNSIIITVISVVAIFGFLGIVYMATSGSSSSQSTSYPSINVIKPDDHVTWSKDKKNILVEYSDLQCPACRAFHDYIKGNIETDKSITGKITFVYRHFPLSIHIHSTEAAIAAEAAGKQGKFFEFADYMFTNQDQWASSNNVNQYFLNAAKDLKLDVNKFKTDISSPDAKKKVDADVASGLSAQVDSTPTFFLNGTKLDNLRSFDDFKKALSQLK